MQPSQSIVEFIQGFEKCRLKAYMPTPHDKPTIGWGSTGDDIKLGTTWTQAQADERFGRDLAVFARGVTAALGPAKTTQGQYDALVAFCYNVGVAAFKKSTLISVHRAGDYSEAAKQFLRWDKQSGKVLAGLTRRRRAEAAIYLNG